MPKPWSSSLLSLFNSIVAFVVSAHAAAAAAAAAAVAGGVGNMAGFCPSPTVVIAVAATTGDPPICSYTS